MRDVTTKIVGGVVAGMMLAVGLSAILGPTLQQLNPYILIGGGLVLMLIANKKLPGMK